MTAYDHLLKKFVIITLEVILNIYKVFRNIGPAHFINKFAIITIEVILFINEVFNYFIDKIIKDSLVILIKLSFFILTQYYFNRKRFTL